MFTSGLVLASAMTTAQPVLLTAPALSCPPAAASGNTDFTPDAIVQRLKGATDRGLLWRIDRDGRTSWLYGTVHLGKPDWLIPGPRVLGALMTSDTMALELDPLDPATRSKLTTPPTTAAMARVLTPERQRRLHAQIVAACLPEGALGTLRPVLQVMALRIMSARADGLYADYGLESFLFGFARAQHKPVVAIETAASQLEMLGGSSEGDEARRVDQGLDDLESGRGRSVVTELADAWARSDWAKLDSYPQWCDCFATPGERQMLKRLLDDRNPGLADGIERLHASGQRVFGAVGALHMIGSQGLPALLTARGFHVTQVLPVSDTVQTTPRLP